MARAYLSSIRGDPIVSQPDIDQFVVSQQSVWINGLWFTSLTLALVVALLAILAKQWLDEHTTRLRAQVASPRRWAWRHVVFSEALAHWGIDNFISSLPFVLHMSLFLFFAGLVLFLHDLHGGIAFFILGLTASVLALYAATTLLPFWYPDCPTVTPFVSQLYRLRCWMWSQMARCAASKPQFFFAKY